MYLLKKVIQLREKAHPDHEKPFLEHLEDLRTMIMKIVITLVISMIVCFAFNNRLMEFFRHPVDEVMLMQTQASLPADGPQAFSVESWEKARKVERAAASLDAEHRAAFYQALGDDKTAMQARSISLYRSAMVLPEDKREHYVDSLPESRDTRLQVKALLKSKPDAEGQAQGNLRMMSALKPTEGFMLSMKLSFVAGIVISFPLLLMFVLQFVLPGLHSHEKKVLWPAMAIGFGLFLCGTTFAYCLVLPRTLLFFYQWSGDMGISNDWRIGEYISFATQFTLLFGASFELPVVVMVFVKLGLLGYETMAKTRSYAIVAIFIAAAVLTPTPDIPTMCIMAAPMLVLYEICIWLAWFERRKNRVLEEQEAREREEHLLAASAEDEHPAYPHADDHEEPAHTGDDGWTTDYEPPDYPENPDVSSEHPVDTDHDVKPPTDDHKDH